MPVYDSIRKRSFKNVFRSSGTGSWSVRLGRFCRMGTACSRLIGCREKSDGGEIRRCRGFKAERIRTSLPRQSLLRQCLNTLAADAERLTAQEIQGLTYDLSQELFDIIVSMDRMTLDLLVKFSQQRLWRLQLGWCRGVDDGWVRPFAASKGAPFAPLLSVNLTESKITNRALLDLSTCPTIKTLVIAGCSSISTYGFLQLRSLTQLEHLDASKCEGVTHYGMTALKGLTRLTALNLSGCHTISPQHAIENLPKNRALRHLNLSWCQGRSSRDGLLSAWKALASLTFLDLGKSCLEQTSYKGLALLTNLASLNLNSHVFSDVVFPKHSCNVSDGPAAVCHAMEPLEQLTKLTALHLRWSEVPEQSWHRLTVLTNLQDLDLAFTELGDRELQKLAPLQALTRLNLDSTEVTDNGMDVFGAGRITTLVKLNLSDTRVTDRGVAYLHCLKGLESLDLSYSSISDYGIEQIAALTSLTYLSIDSRLITSAGLRQLPPLVNLASLDVFGCKMTESGAAAIAKLPKVSYLECAGGTLCDKTVANLCAMSQLTYLSLNQNRQITDFALPSLAKLTNLVSLNIASTGITSAGLHHLHGSTALTSLSVYGLLCQHAHMLEFHTIRPNTDIIGYVWS